MGALENNAAEKKAKAREAAKSKAQADGWRGFVNVELTSSQKAQAKQLMEDTGKLFDNVYSLIDDGYKLTFTHDDVRSAYNVSATCKARNNPNNGLTLTGRGGSLVAAAVSLWFKHDVLLQGVWGQATTEKSAVFRPDEFD